MSKKDKDFYVWAMAECIKSTYENWGIDMTSMYDNIKRDFPNAAKAIHKMYRNLREPEFYESELLTFKKVEYVYEAIANLIPTHKELKFNTFTREMDKEYDCLNMCPWRRFVSIERIDLLMAILLFTEEFIFLPITSKNVILTDAKLTVYGDFVTFKVSKHEEKTYVSIRIRDVMLHYYVILN